MSTKDNENEDKIKHNLMIHDHKRLIEYVSKYYNEKLLNISHDESINKTYDSIFSKI